MKQITKCNFCGLYIEGEEKGDILIYKCKCGSKWTGRKIEFRGIKSRRIATFLGILLDMAGGSGIFTASGLSIDAIVPLKCNQCGGNGYPTPDKQNSHQQYQCETCRVYWWKKVSK